MVQSILVIDDSIADHFLYKEVIQSHDSEIEVHQAYDGQEGYEMVKEGGLRPDLILLDINMPGMNGFEFLDKISTEAGIPTLTIVMLTSSGLDDDKKRASDYECVKDYILKPLRVTDMDNILQIARSHGVGGHSGDAESQSSASN